MEQLKTCTSCKLEKPFSQFSKSVASKDGKAPVCKACNKNYYDANIRNKIEKIIDRQFIGTFGRAKYKNLEHTIAREWFDTKVVAGHCELTGLPFNYTVKVEGARCMPYLPSIDRIDSSKGYTEDNCRVILWCLNQAFGDYGLEFMKPIFAILAGLQPPVDRL